MKSFVQLLTVGVALVFAISRGACADEPPRAVIVISVDGLAAFYWDDPQAEMPTIRALAKEGARATKMKASAPSVTWPNHTTLVTGVTPARHGVVGNDYYDRAQAKPIVLMTAPEAAKELLVLAPTIYDVAKARGLATAAIRWPATALARSLDWTLPDVFSAELLHKYSTPELVKECRAAGIWSDGELVQYKQRELKIVSDETCTKVFNHILHEHRPQLALVHLTHVDTIQHRHGPRTPEAYAAIKSADDLVRQIWDEVRRDYPGSATLMIVSDHGFSPVERMILPNVMLREAGVFAAGDEKAKQENVHVIVQGGAALVYILDKADKAELAERMTRVFAGAEGIDKVVGAKQMPEHGLAPPADDNRTPDLILFAKLGFAFADSSTGQASVAGASDYKGAHGHDENLAELHATFAAWGKGIKPGASLGTIENIDVAPTIAKLLGLNLPGVQGKVLSAALEE